MKLSTLLRFLSCCQAHHPKPQQQTRSRTHDPSPLAPDPLTQHDILTLLLPLLEARQDTPSMRVF